MAALWPEARFPWQPGNKPGAKVSAIFKLRTPSQGVKHRKVAKDCINLSRKLQEDAGSINLSFLVSSGSHSHGQKNPKKLSRLTTLFYMMRLSRMTGGTKQKLELSNQHQGGMTLIKPQLYGKPFCHKIQKCILTIANGNLRFLHSHSDW